MRSGEVWGDASAVLCIIKRGGLGKTRYIDTGLLWRQEVAAEKRWKFGKALGRDNPADFYTKYLDWETMRRHSERISADVVDGRAATAPELHMMKAMWDTVDTHFDPTYVLTESGHDLVQHYSIKASHPEMPYAMHFLSMMCALSNGAKIALFPSSDSPLFIFFLTRQN